MTITFENHNNKLQGQSFIAIPKAGEGMNEFQKKIMEMIFHSPRLKVVETQMRGKKMVLEVIKKGQ